MKVIIHPAVESARLTRLCEAAPSVQFVNAANPLEATRELADADALLGKITQPLLLAARRLRWVQSFTASLEHYMFPALVEHPCVLTNMRGLFSDVIADQVVGYVICLGRNLHTYIRQQSRRHWGPVGGEAERVNLAAGPGVPNSIDHAHAHFSDQTIGVVGLGAIGGEVARRAKAFGMRVIAIDPRRTDCPAEVDWLRPPERLNDLLAESDYVVITAPHTPRTERLFGREQFQAMKRSAYLLNVGRGAIVGLNDLVAALRAGDIAGAALDVFETEPLPSDHPLWEFPNVILTPHVAGYSPRIAERHLQLLVDNVRRFAAGEPLLNVVDKCEWY